MKTIEIAKKHKVSRFFVMMVSKGTRKTMNIGLAQAIASKNGGAPIDYITIKVRKFALQAHPYLSKRVKKNA